MWRFFFVLAVFMLSGPLVAEAQLVPDTCAADFHMSLRDRAWMEGQREIEVSQVLITKARSVLDYTCFEEAAKRAGQSGVFSEDLSGAIEKVLAGGSFECISMQTAWNAVRCSNLDQNTVFPALGEIAFQDFRGCSSSRSAANWRSAHESVNGMRSGSPAWGTDNLPDQAQTFAARKKAADCANSAIIKSGLKLEDGTDAGTCLASGCVFNGESCVASNSGDSDS